jgi:tetratricopeptide (TPR) repeat protein
VEFACSSAWVTNCLGYQPLELRLQVDVALPLVAIQGQARDEVTAVLSRARDLNQKLGETPQTFGAIRALHWLSFAHADYRGAFELCEQLSRIAERVNNPDFRAEALRARANSSFYLCQLTDSRELFERVLSICDREDRGAQVFADAEDPGAPAAGQLAIVLWILGYPDQALSTVQGAVATARALAAPFMMAVTQSFLASLLRLLRDIPATLEAANAAIAICDDQGFAFWHAQAAVTRTSRGDKHASALEQAKQAQGGSPNPRRCLWVVYGGVEHPRFNRSSETAARPLMLLRSHRFSFMLRFHFVGFMAPLMCRSQRDAETESTH